MIDLAVIHSRTEERQEAIVSALKRYLADAEAGKFVEVFIVGRHAPDSGDPMSHSYSIVGAGKIETVGWLELFKQKLIKEATED